MRKSGGLLLQQSSDGRGVWGIDAKTGATFQYSAGNTVQLKGAPLLSVYQHGRFDRIEGTDQLEHFVEVFLSEIHIIGP